MSESIGPQSEVVGFVAPLNYSEALGSWWREIVVRAERMGVAVPTNMNQGDAELLRFGCFALKVAWDAIRDSGPPVQMTDTVECRMCSGHGYLQMECYAVRDGRTQPAMISIACPICEGVSRIATTSARVFVLSEIFRRYRGFDTVETVAARYGLPKRVWVRLENGNEPIPPELLNRVGLF